MSRQRIDRLLVERGIFESRSKAQAAVEAGLVRAGGAVVRRASDKVDVDAVLEAVAAHPWVGRGALKLLAALDMWPIIVQGRVALDVGASTGGFTEVCLARGARRVFAVDVGRGQLHPSLDADPRVINLSATDARRLDGSMIVEAPELVVCDISFIGLAKALPAALALALAAPGADLIALVKPQFEVGPERVGRGGLVRDEADRLQAVEAVEAFLVAAGWTPRDRAESPIMGGEGAVEYLVWATKSA